MLAVVLHQFCSGAIFGALAGIIIAVIATLNSVSDSDGLKKWAVTLVKFIVIAVISLALIFGSVWSILGIISSW